MTSTATSNTGAIVVETTETGVPVAVSIEAAELRRDPADLAVELLRLCRRAAARAGAARRRELAAAGVAPDLLALSGLPTDDEVRRQELLDEQDFELEPQSWLHEA